MAQKKTTKKINQEWNGDKGSGTDRIESIG
jgi:hypothetical protein